MPTPTPTTTPPTTTPPSSGSAAISVADASERPRATVFGQAIGSVVPGALFYIDATNKSGEITATLLLTNSDELVPNYGYWVLNVGIFVETGDNQWEKAKTSTGETIPDTYLTLRNTQCSFKLNGSAKYKVSITGGNFYCTKATQSGLAPKFYLEVD